MKLCSKCKKRPAVVFMSNPLDPNGETEGLCLACAKELGIKPVDDMLKSMNISDEDIEQMSNQFLEAMSADGLDIDDEALNDGTFDLGTAPAIPFIKNLFGGSQGNTSEKTDASNTKSDKPKKKKRRFTEQYCNNLTQRAKEGKLDTVIGREKELDRMLQESVTEYNDAYTIMNDKGVQLFVERSRSIDTIVFVEALVNSIANRPKSFDTEFEEIRTNRRKFTDSCEFANRELTEARKAATGAGAGLAAGASVAFMAPTAAMWIATTFGTASTGAAISTLSGAAATNAALAWLGGGAIAAGGGGMAAGNAFLALAGPVGWTIAGATLLSSILIFTAKKTKLNKQKNEEILAIKQNTELVHEMDAQIGTILSETSEVRNKLNEMYLKAVSLFGTDYLSLNNEQKYLLGALVNNTKALAALFGKMIGVEDGEESE